MPTVPGRRGRWAGAVGRARCTGAGRLPAAALDRPAPTSAALTLLLERVGAGWGDWEGAVPEAAEGHPPHPCSPRGRQGWQGSWGPCCTSR